MKRRIAGVRVELSDLVVFDGTIKEYDGREDDEGLETPASIWYLKDGLGGLIPLIAEPYRESSDGSRWYYSRTTDFDILDSDLAGFETERHFMVGAADRAYEKWSAEYEKKLFA